MGRGQCAARLQATFVETVAKHAEAGVITGISDIRDESDRDGMRVVVELKRGIAPEVWTPDLVCLDLLPANALPSTPYRLVCHCQVVLNNLYKHTVLQSRFACNMVALVSGKPIVLDLKQFLAHFLEFR